MSTEPKRKRSDFVMNGLEESSHPRKKTRRSRRSKDNQEEDTTGYGGETNTTQHGANVDRHDGTSAIILAATRVPLNDRQGKDKANANSRGEHPTLPNFDKASSNNVTRNAELPKESHSHYETTTVSIEVTSAKHSPLLLGKQESPKPLQGPDEALGYNNVEPPTSAKGGEDSHSGESSSTSHTNMHSQPPGITGDAISAKDTLSISADGTGYEPETRVGEGHPKSTGIEHEVAAGGRRRKRHRSRQSAVINGNALAGQGDSSGSTPLEKSLETRKRQDENQINSDKGQHQPQKRGEERLNGEPWRKRRSPSQVNAGSAVVMIPKDNPILLMEGKEYTNPALDEYEATFNSNNQRLILSKGAKDVTTKERRQKRHMHVRSSPQPQKDPTGRPEPEIASAKRAQQSPPRKAPRRRRPRGQATWELGRAIGGRIVNVDPVFTSNEGCVHLNFIGTVLFELPQPKLMIQHSHFVLAYPSSINFYSIERSSLIQSLPVATSAKSQAEVTCYGLSATRPEQLYVGSAQGIIYQFDWNKGQKLGRWQLNSHVWGLEVAGQESSGGRMDVVYTREQAPDRWILSAHKLRGGTDASKTESRTIYSSPAPITHFKLILDGKVIVVTAGSRLLVGHTTNDGATSLKDLKYVWREFVAPNSIASFDVRHVSKDSTIRQRGVKSMHPPAANEVIDVVVGDAKGVIFVYDDLLNNLVSLEHDKDAATGNRMAPRRLHWHRESVLSVKWSLDGNYIISGGSETVLVLWQLETNQQQFLPHLSAPIESIVVSPKGTAYAIRLADNTTMVLSTSELSPKAYVGGVQAEILLHFVSPDFHLRMKEDTDSRDAEASLRVPAVPATINPANPSQVLVAAPSYESFSGGDRGSPYLQTVDIATAHHVNRQALTRTNITISNLGPEGNKLVEPTLTFVKVSCDGQWLASVDEWTPPVQDLEPLVSSYDDLDSEVQRRREIYIKFWAWNSADKQWALVTAITTPHIFDGNAGRILDLQADPREPRFVTIGEDGSVRLWESKPRLRGGLIVQGENGNPIKDWICSEVVRLERPELLGDSRPRRFYSPKPSVTAHLAYSTDGSALAASRPALEGEGLGVVHFIDTTTVEIHYSRSGLYSGQLIAMGFVERYLITISDELRVWDTVEDCLLHGFTLQSSALFVAHRAKMTHLAVNPVDHTFAVSLPVVNLGAHESLTPRALRKASSQIIVFDPKQPAPVFDFNSTSFVTALLPQVGKPGYVTINAAAELRTLHPRNTALAALDESEQAPAPTPNTPSSALDTLTDTRSEGMPRLGGIKVGPITLRDDRSEDDDNEPATPRPRLQQTTGAPWVMSAQDDTHEVDDDGVPVVRPEQLAEVFDLGPAYSLPPVGELFEQVALLYSKKPLPH